MPLSRDYHRSGTGASARVQLNNEPITMDIQISPIAAELPVPAHISPENGQGMGIPARCTLWRLGHVCKGEIGHNGRFYECQNCRASYGDN